MSLYQEYRPKTLSEVVGNAEVIKSVRAHFSQTDPKLISHCHLIYGDSGTGKTTLARIIATEILQADPTFGIHEINTADNRGIETARDIIEKMRGLPLKGKSTVFVIDECFPGDTELLTNYGYKKFKDLDGSEKIAQYNDNGTVEFVTPIRHIKKKHKGALYSWNAFKDRTIQMTPHHIQPLVSGKNYEITEDYIENTKFSQKKHIIVSGIGVGSLNQMSALDRLAIVSQADGTINYAGKEYNRWVISFKKERKISRFLKIIKNVEKDGYAVNLTRIDTDRPGYKRYTYSTPKTITKDLRTHFSLDVSSQYAEQFIEELVEWDGYRYPNGKYIYYSSINKANVDFCSAVAFLGGYRTNVCVENDTRSDTFNSVYRLTLCKKLLHVTELAKKTIHTEYYDGTVYCVEVPSHKIIVRAGGAFPFVTGNCHGMTQDAKRAFLKPTEDMPKHVYFFFCTTNLAQFIKGDEGKALNTRSTKWKMEPLNARQLGKLVLRTAEAENFNLDDKVLTAIIEKSNGSPREAMVALEQAMGIPDDVGAQLKVLSDGAGEDDPDTLAFCKAVCSSKPSWREIAGLLKNMKGKVDAEQLRRGVLGYCTSIMLNNGNDHISHVMEEFAVDTFATGFPGIVLAAYRSLK